MTLTISDTDLWGDGGNILVALPPSRDDLFVVVTHNGKVIARGTILDYDDAVQNANPLTAAPEWHAAAQASHLHVLEETDGR